MAAKTVTAIHDEGYRPPAEALFLGADREALYFFGQRPPTLRTFTKTGDEVSSIALDLNDGKTPGDHLQPLAGAAIYVSWHRHSVVLSPHYGRYRRWLMTSPAPYLGALRRLATWFGLRLALGTSGDGGAAALDALAAALLRGEAVALAVDGPGGPPFRVKRGCVLLAERTGAPIVPIAYRTLRNKTLEMFGTRCFGSASSTS